MPPRPAVVTTGTDKSAPLLPVFEAPELKPTVRSRAPSTPELELRIATTPHLVCQCPRQSTSNSTRRRCALSENAERAARATRTAGRNSQVPSSALPKQKATSLSNPRSLVGVPVLFRVGTYRTKEERKKITHVPSDMAVGVKLVTSPFSVVFINTVPGLLIDRGLRYRTSGLIDRGLRYRTSGLTRSAVAKTPVD